MKSYTSLSCRCFRPNRCCSSRHPRIFTYSVLPWRFKTLWFFQIIWKMMSETLRFSVFIVLVMCSFALAFNGLFFTCPKESHLGDRFGTFYGALPVVFGASLGDFSFEEFNNIETECPDHPAPERARDAGIFLLVMYLIVMAVILFNLLIAILSTTHSEVRQSVDQGERTCDSMRGNRNRQRRKDAFVSADLTAFTTATIFDASGPVFAAPVLMFRSKPATRGTKQENDSLTDADPSCPSPQVHRNGEMQYHLARTRLIMRSVEAVAHRRIPPPLNLIQLVLGLLFDAFGELRWWFIATKG